MESKTLQQRIAEEKARDTRTPNTFSRLGDTLMGMPIEKLVSETKEKLKNIKPVSCQICQDSHFVYPVNQGRVDYSQVIPCQCVRATMEKKKKENLIKYCEIPEKGRGMTFDNFKVSRSTREAFEACLSMAKGESKYVFLTLMGFSNHGKTHLAMAICNYRLSHDQPAKYTYVPLLLEELKSGFKKEGDDSYLSRYQTFLDVPLLLMDDLGVENPTPWAQEHLNSIVDYRMMHNLSTIVTTNLPIDEIPFRIANRLKRDGNQVIPIVGPEFEVKK